MQEAAFQAVGLKAFYLPFEVRAPEFRRLMRGRRRLSLDGFNVTVPYKETVLSYLDGLNPFARSIGAVNTVVRKGNRWIGFNTDADGFVRSLEKEARFRIRGKRILILGAGGSARAVAYALASRGAGSIAIVNRTPARTRRVISDYRHLFRSVDWKSVSLTEADRKGEADLVVNATSVGLKPGDPSLISPARFLKRTLFVDLIYRPAETRFLRLARQSGHRTLNGMTMLIHQGAEAFRLWTGKRAPINVMRSVTARQCSK